MTRATGQYKAFVEGCVEVANSDIHAARIRKYGHTERDNEDALPLDDREAARKEIFLHLDPAQREVIAQLLEECRQGAIHDLLAKLEWMMACDDFKMIWQGVDIPRSPFSSLHHDFMSRLMDFPWPQDNQG
jgi:hypothetical protein